MDWKFIISTSIAIIGVGISIWAILVAKKSQKETALQNKQAELANIDKELKENNLEIHKLTTEGEERNSHIYGFHPNPNQAQIDALKRRNQDLISRKRELNK
jgi:predicted  nucleic acid-binding Zn-ribbon protein